MSDVSRSAATVLSAVLAGAAPTVATAESVSPPVAEIRLASGCGPSELTAMDFACTQPMGVPSGTLEGTYGLGAALANAGDGGVRTLVLTQLGQREAALYEEHGALVDRSFEVGLSPKEQRRLDYVRWQLHQVQDARQGQRLEELGSRAREYAAFAEEVARLKADLLDRLPKRRA